MWSEVVSVWLGVMDLLLARTRVQEERSTVAFGKRVLPGLVDGTKALMQGDHDTCGRCVCPVVKLVSALSQMFELMRLIRRRTKGGRCD